ncbi:hypothetical protein RF11_14721 [Thelohanellus kitauei]|uniref:Uncharacterized protein n=1 Tax=Thelohanellus kitauei TaxID=669202 RepID=A0A0C2MPK9_THEKT|nr:hypothetical protein RF11_14721 [Thelohanellus kitauei]
MFDPGLCEIVKGPLKFKKDHKKRKTNRLSKNKVEKATKEIKDEKVEETNEKKGSVASVKTKAEIEFEIVKNERVFHFLITRLGNECLKWLRKHIENVLK